MMKYFYGINDLEQAKLRYRTLAKQLHPDKGGDAVEFQKMQEEYNTLLLKIQHNRNAVTPKQTPEMELLNELGKLAKVHILAQNGHPFLLKTDTLSCRKRTAIPEQNGHGFLRKADTCTQEKRTVILGENGQSPRTQSGR